MNGMNNIYVIYFIHQCFKVIGQQVNKFLRWLETISSVAASGPTICTSTYGLEPEPCNRLLIEPSGWAQTVHMFTQRFT